MSYTLIIPIYNEIKTLNKLFKQLDTLDVSIEIILIDDGSNDGSEKILENYCIKNKAVLIRNNSNSGKGFSIKKGLEKATNSNIILADGDIEIDIKEIPSLIKKFDNNDNNILTGVRSSTFVSGKKTINDYGNFFINKIFNIFYKTELKDILCCLKIINKNLIKSLDLQSHRFSIEVEIMAKLVLKNVNILEIDINYQRRTQRQGKKLKISDGLDIVWMMIKIKSGIMKY